MGVFADIQNFALRAHCVHGIPLVCHCIFNSPENCLILRCGVLWCGWCGVAWLDVPRCGVRCRAMQDACAIVWCAVCRDLCHVPCATCRVVCAVPGTVCRAHLLSTPSSTYCVAAPPMSWKQRRSLEGLLDGSGGGGGARPGAGVASSTSTLSSQRPGLCISRGDDPPKGGRKRAGRSRARGWCRSWAQEQRNSSALQSPPTPQDEAH